MIYFADGRYSPLPTSQERLYQQAVQHCGRIEVIAPACVRCIGRIAHGQF